MFKKVFCALMPLVGAVGFVAMGCASTTPIEQDDEHVGAADQALTADQCSYFDVNGTIQICHQLGNGKFSILKLKEAACVAAHGTHDADYVTSTDPNSPLYDPTCNGQGCLPEGAPCDTTIEACEGLKCENGAVVPEATCPCAGGALWDALLTENAQPWPTMIGYLGASGSAMLALPLENGPSGSYFYGLSAINSTTDSRIDQFGGIFPYSTCEVFDETFTPVEIHSGLTDAEANACADLINTWLSHWGACENLPCQNGGTCTPTWDSYYCVCPSGWSGQTCTVPNQPIPM